MANAIQQNDEVQMMTPDVNLEPISPNETEQVNLPRADGGRPALLFLLGCFMAEASTWGQSHRFARGLLGPVTGH